MKDENHYLKNKKSNKLYGIYCSMIYRCHNPKSKSYKNYGGRGIKVCDEWLNDFNKFVEWSLQNGYENQKNIPRALGLSIDRIDNNKDYCPQNCQWISLSENVSKEQFGKQLKDETRAKISEAHKGKKLSNVHKQKLSDSHKGKGIDNKHALKGVYKMMDKYTHEVIAVFEGNKEIESYFSSRNLKCNQANIHQCANGKRKSACGYDWEYERKNDKLCY